VAGCTAITKDGQPCKAQASGGSPFCVSHRHLAEYAYGENCIPTVKQIAVGGSILYALCVDGSLWLTGAFNPQEWRPVNMEKYREEG